MSFLAAAAIGGNIIGGIVSSNSAKKAAKQQAELEAVKGEAIEKISEYNATATEYTAAYNSMIADFNASILEAAAYDARLQGSDLYMREKKAAAEAISQGRAAASSSGFTVDSGSIGRIAVQNAGVGELNARTALENAERQARDLDVAAMNQRAESAGIRYSGALEAENTRMQGKIGNLTSGINAANIRYSGKVASTSALINGFTGAARIGMGM